MSDGLATTFRVLGKTPNEAAVEVLISALDSPNRAVQDGALEALLARRSAACGKELLRRLHTMPPRWREIVRSRRGSVTHTLRDAILGTDRQMCVNACQAAAWFHEYDLIPTLISVLEDQSAENGDLATDTLWELVTQLYDELAAGSKSNEGRDPQMVRRHIVTSLESSVQRFGKHKQHEVIDSFLLLVTRDNPTLSTILKDAHHPAFVSIVEAMSNSRHGGVMRLLLSCLDDRHVPSAVVSVVGKRSDQKFVQHLLRKIGREPTTAVAQNLKRIRLIAWLPCSKEFLDRLDATAQHALVRMVMISAVPREKAFAAIEQVLTHGKPEGRRTAAAALAEFSGVDSNYLAMKVLEDPDPGVQANVLGQLRHRGIPGILPHLISMVDSPHAVVREAARESLTEFTFKRFLASFDMLNEDVQRTTGNLVKKVDPQTVPLLHEELKSKVRSRRLRALAIVRAIDVAEQLEPTIIELLDNSDHMVRIEVVAALAGCPTPASCQALLHALDDSSEAVREAAHKGIESQIGLIRSLESMAGK
ncbi:MAG: HEAT repeat domain-containing protein [Candidatus Nealsonbacteria bacterium]|nr:HEAT repeat domain-containing protein [Candidatus Nealsonbacteria bacterium]